MSVLRRESKRHGGFVFIKSVSSLAGGSSPPANLALYLGCGSLGRLLSSFVVSPLSDASFSRSPALSDHFLGLSRLFSLLGDFLHRFPARTL